MKLYCRLTHENRIVKIDTCSVVTIADDLYHSSEFENEPYVPLMVVYCDTDGNAQIVRDVCDIEVY